MAGETQLHFFYLDHQSNYWERLNAGERESSKVLRVEVISSCSQTSSWPWAATTTSVCLVPGSVWPMTRAWSEWVCLWQPGLSSCLFQGVGDLLCGIERSYLRGLSAHAETCLGSVDSLEGQGSQITSPSNLQDSCKSLISNCCRWSHYRPMARSLSSPFSALMASWCTSRNLTRWLCTRWDRLTPRSTLTPLENLEPVLDFPGRGVLLQPRHQVYLLHSAASRAPV